MLGVMTNCAPGWDWKAGKGEIRGEGGVCRGCRGAWRWMSYGCWASHALPARLLGTVVQVIEPAFDVAWGVGESGGVKGSGLLALAEGLLGGGSWSSVLHSLLQPVNKPG